MNPNTVGITCPDCGAVLDPTDGLCMPCTLVFAEENSQAFAEMVKRVFREDRRARRMTQLTDDEARVLRKCDKWTVSDPPAVRTAIMLERRGLLAQARKIGKWHEYDSTEAGRAALAEWEAKQDG